VGYPHQLQTPAGPEETANGRVARRKRAGGSPGIWEGKTDKSAEGVPPSNEVKKLKITTTVRG